MSFADGIILQEEIMTETKKMTIRLGKETAKKLKVFAAENETSVNNVVARLIETLLQPK